jgi:hypothetical protein
LPFPPTPPIHTHYYTPRDQNDWRNKRIWFNIDQEQPVLICRFHLNRALSSFSLDASCCSIMANVSPSRPQRPHIYDDMGLSLPFSSFSPLSGTNHATSNTLRRRRLQQTTKLLKTHHTSRLTVDIFLTFFIAMLPHVEDIDLSHTAMSRSYLLAELWHLCGTTRPKTTSTGADTRYKLCWPQKQLVAVQDHKSFKRTSHRPLTLVHSRWLLYYLVKVGVFATKRKRRTLYLGWKVSGSIFRRFSAAKQVLFYLVIYCWRQLLFAAKLLS